MLERTGLCTSSKTSFLKWVKVTVTTHCYHCAAAFVLILTFFILQLIFAHEGAQISTFKRTSLDCIPVQESDLAGGVGCAQEGVLFSQTTGPTRVIGERPPRFHWINFYLLRCHFHLINLLGLTETLLTLSI